MRLQEMVIERQDGLHSSFTCSLLSVRWGQRGRAGAGRPLRLPGNRREVHQDERPGELLQNRQQGTGGSGPPGEWTCTLADRCKALWLTATLEVLLFHQWGVPYSLLNIDSMLHTVLVDNVTETNESEIEIMGRFQSSHKSFPSADENLMRRLAWSFFQKKTIVLCLWS